MTDDLEADVARLREKWFGAGASPLRALDAEEEAVAAKWLGKTEAKRLAETRTGQRFRPAVVTGHWGYIPGMRETYSTMGFGAYWYVEVFRNAEKETVFTGGKVGCLQAVARLQRMGISITRVGSERSPEELSSGRPTPSKHQQPSKRLAILNQLARFRA